MARPHAALAKAVKGRPAVRPQARWLWAKRRAIRWTIRMPATPARNPRQLRLARRVKGFAEQELTFFQTFQNGRALSSARLARFSCIPLDADLIYGRSRVP